MDPRDDDERDDEQWLDVLAGRRAEETAATRQAAAVRSEFERLAWMESEMTNNPAGEARLLKFLRDSGTFDEPIAATAAAPTAATAPVSKRREPPAARPSGLVAALAAARDWLLPPGSGHAGRYALVAAIVLAAVAGPLLLNRAPSDDDAASIKSVPRLDVRAEQAITNPRPDEAASRLVSALSALGIAASVEPLGDDRRVTAQVPAASIAAARDSLAADGVSVPAGGELNVRVRKAP